MFVEASTRHVGKRIDVESKLSVARRGTRRKQLRT